MSRICTGIDEAGFGPLLGPLAIAAASARAETADALIAAFAAAPTGVRDSKRLHKSGDLGPLEAVALAAVGWLTGFTPATASELFALMGETPADRAEQPWMGGAEDLVLPCRARAIPTWSIPGVEPIGLQGALLHPADLNRERATGVNRAAAELRRIQTLLAALPAEDGMISRIDRLGGRVYYAEALGEIWPGAEVEILDEAQAVSSYRVTGAAGSHLIDFLVGGESAWPLTAVASCIAKYARELHMRLLNNYWCGRLRALRPTAGYPQDAKRWLHQLGTGLVSAYRTELVRD